MYDYFQRFWANREKALTVIFIGAFLLVAGIWFSYCLRIRNTGKDLPDNGNAAQHVRTEIESAGSNIGAAKSGIDNAAAAAGRIEERISDAQERADYLKGTADEGRRIIAECQSILREVRRRGEENQIKN